MTVDIRHPFESLVAADGDNSRVQGPDWNAPHELMQGPAALLGRADGTAGPTTEILLDPTSLAFVGGRLTTFGTSSVVTLEHFGAKGDGVAGTDTVPATGTDDTAAFQAALDWLVTQGGGTLQLGPYRYILDLPGNTQLSANLSNITIRGSPGQTVLDFSRTTGFYNGAAGVPSGFIATAGTKHDGTTTDVGIMLTNDTFLSTGLIGMVVSGSRSGATVTIAMDGPHGLAAGNLVWVKGDPGITGESILDADGQIISDSQQCFFTVRARTLGPTIPVLVAATPTATSFSFTYSGDLTGQDTVLDIRTAPYVVHASDVMSVPDSSIFSRGERVLLGSLDERGRDNEHCNIGEYQEIGKILTPTLVRFQGSVRDSYRVADGARVFRLSQIVNLTFDGLTIIGKGCNRGAGRGDTALNLVQTHNLTVRRCKFIDCDLMSVFIFYSSKALVEGCTIVQDQRDQAGSESGAIDIVYGVNYGACVDDIVIQRNTVLGGRHAFVQGGSIFDVDFGVARNVRILSNYCAGQWLDPISSHQGCDTMIVDGNHLAGSHGGINPRYARNVIVSNNLVVSEFNGLMLYNDVLNALVSGNVLDAGNYPIQIKSIDNPTANVLPDGGTGNDGKLSRPTPAGPSIQITGNQLRNGRNSIYCVDVTPGLQLAGLEITDNSMVGSRYEAIRVLIGNQTAASLAIASGTYDNATGITTLVLAAGDTRLTAAVPFTLSGLTGTGNFAALNGAQKAIAPTSTIDTVSFVAATGLGAITITAGGLILLATGESYVPLSGSYDSATGVATVRVSSGLPDLAVGNAFTLSGLQGSGNVAALNGPQTASAPTVATTTVTFRDTAGNGATTITGGTLVLPLGGWTGSVSNNRIYDCCLTQSTYQLRFSNPQGVKLNDNLLRGTSSFPFAILVQGDGTTACELMGNSVERTLYTRDAVNLTDIIEANEIVYPGISGSGHKTDMLVREDIEIKGGVAALKFVTTRHLRLRMENLVTPVASGTYDNATGVVVLTTTVPHPYAVGDRVSPAGLVGTGPVGLLEGHTTLTATTATTVTYADSAGNGATTVAAGGAITLVSDDLTSITGAGLDQELTLSTQATNWTITVKHGAGFELDANADKLLNSQLDKMKVIWSAQDNKFVQLTPLMDHG